MQTEELLDRVEAKVKQARPDGYREMLSEVWFLTTRGDYMRQDYVTDNPLQTALNSEMVRARMSALGERGLLSGYVQVTSGWSVDPETGKEQEVLVFNAAGPKGKRVRIYKVVKKGRMKKTCGLIGVFNKWKHHGRIQ